MESGRTKAKNVPSGREMFEMNLYTSIILVELLLLLITAADAVTNRLITKTIRNRLICLCIFIGIAAVAEFIGVLTNGAPVQYIALHKAAKGIEYCCAPICGVIAASAYGGVKDSRVPFALVTAHAIFECVAMCFNWVFSIDAGNVSHRESLYFVYIAAFGLSAIYIFVCMIRSGKEYQTGMDGVLVLTLILLAFGIIIQFIFSDIRIDYLCVAIASYLLYARYSRMVLQVDAITGLLNRRCYETNISRIGSRAVILYFDVNNFKQVNDTYGHNIGDLCLRSIAERLRSVYGKFGSCYRIGGDEFCVVLESHLDSMDALNETFLKAIESLKKADPRMPGVAVGYAIYDSATTHIRKAIEEADEMMYRNKRRMAKE